MTSLLIVESPNKAKSIRKYFPDFKVVATVGHFRDLPENDIGVEPPDHKPTYVTMAGKTDVEKQLRAQAKLSSVIYIATDPDREGEAIAAHVAQCLQSYQSRLYRITYVEVSQKAIQAAINDKRQIDWDLVRAQEARRVIDRYVGYLVSPKVSQAIQRVNGAIPFLSAGRVQSVALKLVVERDKAITSFKPVTHYGVQLSLEKTGQVFTADWCPQLDNTLLAEGLADDPDIDSVIETGDPIARHVLTDAALAQAVVERTDRVTVMRVERKTVETRPPAPLTTSSFVKLMSVLSISTKSSMDAAQALFEAGLITYHRTDSPMMSIEFTEVVRDYLRFKSLPLSPEVRRYSAKAGAQEGHECLRVTDITREQAGLTDSLLNSVYRLVWQYTAQSQMASALDERTRVVLRNDSGDLFVAYGLVEVQPGWRLLKITAEAGALRGAKTEAEKINGGEEKKQKDRKLPAIAEGDAPVLRDKKVVVKKTQAPAPHTEKSLVAKLDQLKIGRPSTYAATIERIVKQGYVSRSTKLVMTATPLGAVLVDALDGRCDFMNYAYTADLERLLDKVATRKMAYTDLVDAVYTSVIDNCETLARCEWPDSFCDAVKALNPATPATLPKPTGARAADAKRHSTNR